MSNLAYEFDGNGNAQARLPRILILDDSDFDRKRLRRAFAKFPSACKISEAVGLTDFQDKLRQEAHDLILIDYALADGDGIEALRLCRECEQNRDALLVMVTGNDSSSLAVNAMKAGFDDYVSKDDVSRDRLGALLSKSGETRRLNVNVLDFPNAAPVTTAPAETSEDAQAAIPDIGAELSKQLTPALQDLVRSTLSRLRAEEYSEALVLMLSQMDDPDEFIFR